jgi:hypothetical protein
VTIRRRQNHWRQNDEEFEIKHDAMRLAGARPTSKNVAKMIGGKMIRTFGRTRNQNKIILPPMILPSRALRGS